MVFKLAGDRSFDGPVAGIVDARRHLVGQQAALVLEKLDGQYADILQRFHNSAGNILGRALHRRLKSRSRRKREAKNAAAMMLFTERVKSGLSLARPHGEDGECA